MKVLHSRLFVSIRGSRLFLFGSGYAGLELHRFQLSTRRNPVILYPESGESQKRCAERDLRAVKSQPLNALSQPLEIRVA